MAHVLLCGNTREKMKLCSRVLTEIHKDYKFDTVAKKKKNVKNLMLNMHFAMVEKDRMVDQTIFNCIHTCVTVKTQRNKSISD